MSSDGRLNVPRLGTVLRLKPETLRLNGKVPYYAQSGLMTEAIDDVFPGKGTADDPIVVSGESKTRAGAAKWRYFLPRQLGPAHLLIATCFCFVLHAYLFRGGPMRSLSTPAAC